MKVGFSPQNSKSQDGRPDRKRQPPSPSRSLRFSLTSKYPLLVTSSLSKLGNPLAQTRQTKTRKKKHRATEHQRFRLLLGRGHHRMVFHHQLQQLGTGLHHRHEPGQRPFGTPDAASFFFMCLHIWLFRLDVGPPRDRKIG